MVGQPRPRSLGPGYNANPEMRKAVELLADGQWHPYHRIVEIISREVEPGRAIRLNERLRAGTANAPAERKQPADIDQLQRYGAKAYARAALRHKRWFQIEPHGKVPPGVTKMIRLRPEDEERES